MKWTTAIGMLLIAASILALNSFFAVSAYADCAPPPLGLAGWWPGEGNAKDLAGTNNGTLSDSGVTFVNGKVGQGFRLDGTNGFVQIPDSSALKPTNVTVEAWVWLDPAVSPGTEVIIFKRNSWTYLFEGYNLAKEHTDNGDGTFTDRFSLVIANNGNQVITRSTTVVQRGVWYHVAGTYDGNKATIWVNGVAEASNIAGFALDYGTRPVFIGMTGEPAPYVNPLAGIIDEPAIYNRALSQTEIQSIYNAGSAGKCLPSCTPAPAGLVSWWPAEGNVNDIAGTNNDIAQNITYTNGETGQAFVLNDTNAYMYAPASPSLNVGLSNGLTIEGWIKLSNVDFFHPIVEWNSGLGDLNGKVGVQLWLGTYPGTQSGILQGALVDTSGNTYVLDSPAGAVAPNVFQHVAMTYDRTSGLGTLYVNGVIVAQQNVGNIILQTSYDFWVGHRPGDVPGDITYGTYLGGLLDELSVYNRGLSSNEIAAIYNSGSLGKCGSFSTPVIFSQPTNQAALTNATATFTVLAGGAPPLSYRWYSNSTPLSDNGHITGSSTSSLVISNVQRADATNYLVVITNSFGSVTSSVASLTVVATPPTITLQPQSQTVVAGANIVFTTAVTGDAPLYFQWYLNGNPLTDNARIAGSANTNLTISNVQVSDAGNYTFIVTNLASSMTSTTAVLTVLVPPAITTQPIGRSVPPGLPTTIAAAAAGSPLNLQWQLNGTNIPGATNTIYSLAAVGTNDIGFYHLVASNVLNVAVSADAQLTFGSVAAWGRNLFGESLPPPGLTNVTAVAGTFGASFALRTDGTIAAWGSGPATNIPAGATNVVAIAASGSLANYALRSDGTMVGWNGASTPPLSNLVAIAAGNNFSYVLRAEGTVTNLGKAAVPDFPAGLNHVTAIACGFNNAMALRNDGTIVIAGGGVVTNVPIGLTNVVAIAAGYTYAMALKANGTVVAWGSGTGTNLPVGMTNIIAISAGNYPGENFGLAVRANGRVVAWGDNSFLETNPPAALTNLISIAGAAAPYHGLALVNDGSPLILHPPVGLTAYTGRDVTLHGDAAGAQTLSYQWRFNGSNIYGATNTSLVISNIQFSNAGNYQLLVSNNVNTALSLAAPLTVVSNSTLTFLTQPTASNTNVYQGGTTSVGVTVLGSGPLHYQWFFTTSNFNPVFTAVSGATNEILALNPALAIQSGYYRVVVSNQFNVTTSSLTSFVRVQFAKSWGYLAADPPINVTNAVAIAVGIGAQTGSAFGHYLVLKSDGKISSWSGGFANYGETNVAALSNSIVTAIAAGNQDSLALKSDGTVSAWGYNGYGETNVPSGLSGVTAIACGDYHDLALKSDGTIAGWGQSIYSQTTNAAATNVVAIAASGSDSMVLRADGTVVNWGFFSPTIPSNATNVIAIAAGVQHYLALRANGTVIGWGNNTYGQTTIPASWTNIVAISAALNHSIALRNDGTVLTLGNYQNGPTSLPGSVPSDLANVIAIASGGDHDLGLFGTRAPAFTVQPWNRTIPLNSSTNIILASKCAGVQPMSYQWQLNGTNLPGAINDFLVLTNLPIPAPGGPGKFIQSGVYQLIASNAYGVVASKPAKLIMVYPLGDAVDATNLNWASTGNAQWSGETNVTHDGVDAARSGGIGALQETILQTTFGTNQPGSYSFWWKVSSEQFFDILEFRVNGTVQASISGEVDWQKVSIPVAAGTNVLQWRYSKDASFDSGLDAAFVDQFAYLSAPPIITSQPLSRTNYSGTIATFNVSASGAEPLGYQWRKNGANLGSPNSPNLILNNVQASAAASYSVVVTNAGGSVTSSPALLVVLDSAPVITSSPVGRTNNAGTTATFSATAIGTMPMNYQWRKDDLNLTDGGNVSGSASASLTLPNVQDADIAGYSLVITNVIGSVTSSPAMLAVIDGPPVITSQPSSTANMPGGTATFAVTASGTAPLSYQWHFNGLNLDLATNAVLTINNLSSTNVGSYQALVTNTYGAITSSIATLTLERSMIVAWGDNTYGQTNVPAGLNSVTAIAAGDFHNLALQPEGTVVAWGYNVYGATNVPVNLSNIVAIAGGGYQSLALQADGTMRVWGPSVYGISSVPAGLTNVAAIAGGYFFNLALRTDGTVTAWGDNSSGQTNVPSGLTNVMAIAGGDWHGLALRTDGTVAAWGDNAFGQTNVPSGLTNVVAIAAGTYHNLALQANGAVVAWGYNNYGQINVPSGLTNVVAIAAGFYHNLVLRADGTVVAWGENSFGQNNVPVDLTNVVAIKAGSLHSLALVNDGSPVIIRQPANKSVSGNAAVQFDVVVVGASDLHYQWQKNGANLSDGGNVSGSSTPSLMLSNVQTADMAIYSVLTTNKFNAVASSSAVLTIAGPPAIIMQPVSQTVNSGTIVQFNVIAIGNPSLAYQWWRNGTNPVGGNSPTLTLTSVGRAQSGTYTVMVTNNMGGIISSNAVLKVLVPQLLGAPALSSDGTLTFTSTDANGGLLSPSDLANFEAQASTNLVNWMTLTNGLILTNGMLQLQDGAQSNFNARYYRLIEH